MEEVNNSDIVVKTEDDQLRDDFIQWNENKFESDDNIEKKIITWLQLTEEQWKSESFFVKEIEKWNSIVDEEMGKLKIHVLSHGLRISFDHLLSIRLKTFIENHLDGDWYNYLDLNNCYEKYENNYGLEIKQLFKNDLDSEFSYLKENIVAVFYWFHIKHTFKYYWLPLITKKQYRKNYELNEKEEEMKDLIKKIYQNNVTQDDNVKYNLCRNFFKIALLNDHLKKWSVFYKLYLYIPYIVKMLKLPYTPNQMLALFHNLMYCYYTPKLAYNMFSDNRKRKRENNHEYELENAKKCNPKVVKNKDNLYIYSTHKKADNIHSLNAKYYDINNFYFFKRNYCLDLWEKKGDGPYFQDSLGNVTVVKNIDAKN